MSATKLELLFFVLFLLPGLSLIGISFQETDILKSILNAFVGFLSLLAALVVLWRWFVFKLELQSRGLFVRQLVWNGHEFKPVVREFFIPYEEMRIVFYRPNTGQKPSVYGIVLKGNKGTDLSNEISQLESHDAPSLYQEAVLGDGTSHQVFTTRLLDEKQMKILTADLILRVPNLKLEENLRILMGLEQRGIKFRSSFNWWLTIALVPVAVMTVVLYILKILNRI
ncbi:hypothetical protein [Desulfolucanica intricata]|uniref:hypothetical protein n=1 Tax=Desulfolucanica intricata TaxID=1285191 RepID=UPI00082EE870|nr:hypothetical protein [Desulfolucanica intricata]